MNEWQKKYKRNEGSTWKGVYRIKAKEKGKKLKIRSNEKYQRDMKVAILGEERIKHKVCKAYSQTNSGGLGLLSTQDIAK